jgi:hypothetical protein
MDAEEAMAAFQKAVEETLLFSVVPSDAAMY